MRSQQEAERAEQQRIKNLVLNYDLNSDNTTQHENGTLDPFAIAEEESSFHYVLQPNPNGNGQNAANTRRNRQPQLVGKGVLNNPLDFNYAELRQLSRGKKKKKEDIPPTAPAAPSKRPSDRR